MKNSHGSCRPHNLREYDKLQNLKIMEPTKKSKQKEHRFSVEIEYSDESSFFFDVILEGEPHQYMAHLQMIARGTLMASNARKAIAYNEEGFYVVSYIR